MIVTVNSLYQTIWRFPLQDQADRLQRMRRRGFPIRQKTLEILTSRPMKIPMPSRLLPLPQRRKVIQTPGERGSSSSESEEDDAVARARSKQAAAMRRAKTTSKKGGKRKLG